MRHGPREREFWWREKSQGEIVTSITPSTLSYALGHGYSLGR